MGELKFNKPVNVGQLAAELKAAGVDAGVKSDGEVTIYLKETATTADAVKVADVVAAHVPEKELTYDERRAELKAAIVDADSLNALKLAVLKVLGL